jgi:hypothetical protein
LLTEVYFAFGCVHLVHLHVDICPWACMCLHVHVCACVYLVCGEWCRPYQPAIHVAFAISALGAEMAVSFLDTVLVMAHSTLYLPSFLLGREQLGPKLPW